jgi:alpha-mannosidase
MRIVSPLSSSPSHLTPLITLEPPSPTSTTSTSLPSSLIIDCIKRGEDDVDVSRGELPKRKGQSVIVRLYESMGGTTRGTLVVDARWSGKVKGVRRVNVLEDDVKDEQGGDGVYKVMSGGRVEVELRPFEVLTLRLQL